MKPSPTTRFVVNDERTAPFVAAQCGGSGFIGQLTTLGVERGGEIIAGVVLDGYNVASLNIHVGAKCGSRWLSRDFMRFVFGYAFDGLKVKRLTGLVAEGNRRAQEFDERLGFVLEARLAEAHPSGALLVYRMLRSECRWLNQ